MSCWCLFLHFLWMWHWAHWCEEQQRILYKWQKLKRNNNDYFTGKSKKKKKKNPKEMYGRFFDFDIKTLWNPGPTYFNCSWNYQSNCKLGSTGNNKSISVKLGHSVQRLWIPLQFCSRPKSWRIALYLHRRYRHLLLLVWHFPQAQQAELRHFNGCHSNGSTPLDSVCVGAIIGR